MLSQVPLDLVIAPRPEEIEAQDKPAYLASICVQVLMMERPCIVYKYAC